MRLPDKVKFLLVLCSGFIIFFSGCVDTSVQTIPDQIIYKSQVRFTNLVAGAGTATLTLNGSSIGTVGFGEETSDMTVQAGSKTLAVSYATAPSQQYSFSTETDFKLRVYLIGTDSSNSYEKNLQRYIFQTPVTPQDSADVAFFNGSPDITLNGITLNGAETTDIDLGDMSLGDSQPYMAVKAGTYSFDIAYNDSLQASFTATHPINANHRYTVVVYDTESNLKLKVFTDD